MADKSKKQKNPKKRCPECGRVMKQQFIGLRHYNPLFFWHKYAYALGVFPGCRYVASSVRGGPLQILLRKFEAGARTACWGTPPIPRQISLALICLKAVAPLRLLRPFGAE